MSQLTVKECILNSAPKSCDLDPIHSKLLIECLDSILPSLTDLFNSSLASGIFQQCFKSALVTPILKKRCLDHNDLNNYRPVSNLCFIAKILQKLVLSQVSSYLNSHNLYNTCQSAYCPGHSTETALLKVVDDLFLSFYKGNISVLPLLDFFQHLTQLIILSLYTVSILTMDLLMLSFNGFHLIRLIVHTTSLYLIIVLLLLLYTQVFLRVQFLDLCFSPCIFSFCLPLLTRTLSDTIHFLTTYNNGCQLPLIEYLNYFTLCSHAYVMSNLGQLRTCLNLMTTRQNSCLPPLKELSIYITYLLQSQ